MKTGERKSDAPTNEDLAASFQYSVVRWIVEKSLAACELKDVQHLVVGGGVSANSHLRAELIRQAGELGIEVFLPPLELTGDNAAMIARRGLELFEKGKFSDLKLTAKPNLRI
jgi:N6-L-threonylcarbamoyladenine synthase